MSLCEARRGDDVPLVVTATDCNSGAAIPIENMQTITWGLYALKGYPDDYERYEGTQLLAKDLTDGIEIVDGPNGVFKVSLTEADTASLQPGTYYNESRMMDAQGNTTTAELQDLTILASALQG